MQDIERAYGGVEDRYRGVRSAYGGEVPTAQARTGQQLELERGAGMAGEVRKFEEFLANLGDERMRSIFLPFLAQMLNQLQAGQAQREQQRATKASKPSDFERGLGSLESLSRTFSNIGGGFTGLGLK
jgi:hypothetical protein